MHQPGSEPPQEAVARRPAAPPAAWVLAYDGYDPASERLREALCTLGNGYVATRGAAPETHADDVHYPGTYIAGLYDRLTTEISGRDIENEDLVNIPNWLPLTFRLPGGEWFHPDRVELLDYRQELDVHRGILTRIIRFSDPSGRRTTVTQRRFVSMDDLHLAGLEVTITPENWSGPVEIRSALDGCVENAGVDRYRAFDGRHLDDISCGASGDDIVWLAAHTRSSRVRLGVAQRTRLLVGGHPIDRPFAPVDDGCRIAQMCTVDTGPGLPVTIEKIVAIHASGDAAIAEPRLASRNAVTRAPRFDDLLERHILAWDQLWGRFGMTIDVGEGADLILHLHVFHLLQTVSAHSIGRDVGVPARGLHGEAYRGHIFWDEVFVHPMVALRIPEITRALLAYRVNRLPEARWAARVAGYSGAMYPWQSGSDGREESQVVHLNPRSGNWIPDNSRLQRHIGSAIAYSFWQYYQATCDTQFLAYSGAEVILEIARFWSSIATYNHSLDRYEIRGVMGPDEYHDAYPGASTPGLDNNAYTNLMAVWVLHRAFDVLRLVAPHRADEIRDVVGLTAEELDRWGDITRKMYVPFHGDGIISQFEGYDQLEEFDWGGYRQRYGDIHRLDRILEAEGDSANRYKVSKQADVLMLFYLLSGEELQDLFGGLGLHFDETTIPRNIDYYLARTSHGSTLSGVVHSWLLASVDRRRSWGLFLEALRSDVADVQGGTTPEGIHLGAMAGTVDVMLRCYPGISMREGVLWFDPQLPEEIGELSFGIRYRGVWVEVTLDRTTLHLLTRDAAPDGIRVGFRREVVDIPPGESRTFSL